MGLVKRQALRWLSVAGVFAGAVIAVSANVLASRFYARWDVTTGGLYTLSQATLETLHGLSEPIDIAVFLSASDPMTLSVQQMLSSYQAETHLLRPRYVDPDRDPAEFLALQKEYGVSVGKTEDGKVVTDASLVIAHGSQHWFVNNDDMVQYNERDNTARPRLEQALTEGIRNVLSKEKTLVCFTTGHQELSADDGGPHGLAELKYRIQKDNYTTKTVDLGSPEKDQSLEGCRVVIVPGPDVAFDPASAKRLENYFAKGGNLFLLVNPILDEDNRIKPSGLESVATRGGLELGADFVIERNREFRMPQGLGETYFATPKPHDVTAGLLDDETPKLRPLLTAAQSVRVVKDGLGQALLVTSADAFSVKDIRPFVDEGRAVEKRTGDASGPFAIAAAAELAKPAASVERHGPRMVVVGTANVAFGQVFRDATMLGDRVFLESAVAWLAAKPAVVSIPEKPTHPAGLSLTEDSLGETLRYVLVYLPGSALGLGVLILFRRRATERKSRRDAASPEKAGRS
jgi:hypothetical protein